MGRQLRSSIILCLFALLGCTNPIANKTTTEMGDYEPDVFYFSPIVGAAANSEITSSAIILSGFGGTLRATVFGNGSPVILIDNVVIGDVASVHSGDTLSIRMTASPTGNVTRQAVLMIGSVSASLNVTTANGGTTAGISSVTAPANGSYKQGTQLDFSAVFDENIFVTGTPRFILNIGGATKYATYVSGSGTTNLLFRYVVEAGTTDSNGIGVSSLQLNGGTIRGSTGNDADLSFFTPDTSLVIVDTTAPSVASITPPANGTYFLSNDLNFTVNYNEPMTVTGTPRLQIMIGSTTRYANYVSGSGSANLLFRYTVQSTDVDNDGISFAATSIDLNGGTLTDIATNTANLSFSAPNTSGVLVSQCPTGYVPVPPLSGYTTALFCVAKYEMKNVGGVATSVAAGQPWTSVSRNTALTYCSNLGSSYSLITNAQWQAMARNIESVAANWDTGTVGSSGGLSRGHSDSAPFDTLAASTDDNDACSGTNQTCSLSTWDAQRRVFKLSNGAYVWDVAGNASEWVADGNTTIYGSNDYVSQITDSNHSTINTIGGLSGTAKFHFGPAGNYTSLNSGNYGGLGQMSIDYQAGAIRRGGYYTEGVSSGVFTVATWASVTSAPAYAGFRCVYTP